MNDNLTVAELAYMAGFVDGEGCIATRRHVQNGRPYFRPNLTIGQRERLPLDWVHQRFGGFVLVLRRRGFRWQISNRRALDVLEAIEPYLVLKQPQARLLLTFTHYPLGTVRLSDDEVTKREQIHLQLQMLKRPS